MWEILLSPDQIIATNWKSLQNIKMLQAYFLLCRESLSEKLPPVMVMHRDDIEPFFIQGLGKIFRRFIASNPAAEYFLLDGSHRTTAAALAGGLCPGVLIHNQDDLEGMKKLSGQGRIFKHTLGESFAGINDTVAIIRQRLLGHFEKTGYFRSVSQKNELMMKEGFLPAYMVEYFKANDGTFNITPSSTVPA